MPSELRIIFEDEALLAVSKPAGIKVHGRVGEPSIEALVEKLIGRRAILLHRLDKDTTGILLLAKRKDAAAPLSRAFEEKRIRKTYHAIVEGRWPKVVNKVESFISPDPSDPRRQVSQAQAIEGARRALTTFRLLREGAARTLLEALPKTGRTHQIRLHCASVGHPIVGDRLYGQTDQQHQAGAADLAPHPGLALHAYRLQFRHPITDVDMDLIEKPPEHWAELF